MPPPETKEPESSQSKDAVSNARRKWKWPYLLFFAATAFALLRAYLFFSHITLEGKAVALKQVEVQTVEEGILKEVRALNAQPIKAGDLLFRFQNDALGLDLSRAEEKKKELTERRIHLKEVYDHTATMVERANILFENGVISKTQLEETLLESSRNRFALNELDAQIEASELELSALKARTESLNIRSPFDGIFLGDIESKKDTYFKKGESLGLVFDPTEFCLEAYLSETKVLDLKVEDSARVTFKGLPGVYNGRVTQMNQRVTEEIEKVFKTKHVLRVLIQLDHFPEGLKPGMRGKARIAKSWKIPGV